MPFTRPTLQQLIDRNESDYASRLPGSDPRLRRAFLNVMARIDAGSAHGLYGYLAYIFRQLFPDTAEAEFLERWADIWGVERKLATKSSGTATATGNNGSTISQGALLRRSDGVEFAVTENATIVSGVATVKLEATTAGSSGNTAASSTLTFQSPPPGVNSTVTVTANGLTGGTDVETDALLLQRLLLRIQNPPQGGAKHDYIAWALENAGVTRAWCYPLELGLGTVTVRFMMDGTYADGIPQAGDVAAVLAYIEERRPVTADVTVVAPVASPIDFNITLNINDTPEIRAAVEAELKDMILRDSEPGGTIYLSRINEAISRASGVFDHILNSPNANVVHPTGNIATFGSVTFT